MLDGAERQREEESLQAKEAQLSDEQGRMERLRASSVAGSLWNSDLNARLNGMDPKSPYVTQRPQQSYFWYKLSEGEVERRDAGVPLAKIDAGLSCARFRDPTWVRQNRPEWPPNLVQQLDKFTAAVPQAPIIMPPKGGPPSPGEVIF